MRTETSFHINHPCSESWQEMSKNEQGRFCAACQKTVVDFTAMSDNEILTWFASNNPKTSAGSRSGKGVAEIHSHGDAPATEPSPATSLNHLPGLNARRNGPLGVPPSLQVCGRFAASQLNRPLTFQRQRQYAPAALWRYLIAGLLVSSEASAQTQSAPPVTVQSDSSTKADPLKIGKVLLKSLQPGSPGDSSISGRVLDEKDRPIVNASVMVLGRNKGVLTDEKGQFHLSASALGSATRLQISSIGYVSQTILLDDKYYSNQELIFRMKENVQGDVDVIAGYVVVAKKKRKPVPALFEKIKDTIASCTGLGKKPLKVYPNPVSRGSSVNLSINLDQTGTYTAQLYSLGGALLESMEIEGGRQEKHVLMDIPSTLAPGNYIIRLSHPSLKKPFLQQIAVF